MRGFRWRHHASILTRNTSICMDVHFFRGLIELALSTKRKWSYDSCGFELDGSSHWSQKHPSLNWSTVVKLSRVSKGCMELFDSYKKQLMIATMSYSYWVRARSGDWSDEEYELNVGPFNLFYDALYENRLYVSHDGDVFGPIEISKTPYPIFPSDQCHVNLHIGSVGVFSKEFLEYFGVYDLLKQHGFPDIVLTMPTPTEKKMLEDANEKRNEESKKKRDAERKLVKKRIVKMVKRGSKWITIKTKNSTIYRQR